MPQPAPRRQLNVRLPPDILEQVEADDRSNREIVEAALRAWFADDSSENGGGRGGDSIMIAALVGQLAAKDRQLEAKDEQFAAAFVLWHGAITPPLQLQAAEQEAQAGRKWWEFWK